MSDDYRSGSQDGSVSFADLFKRARAGQSLSQRQAAEQLGVTPVTITRWESGRSGVVQPRLRPRLAEFLGVQPPELDQVLRGERAADNVVPLFEGAAPKVIGESSLSASNAAPSSPDLTVSATRLMIEAIAKLPEARSPHGPSDAETKLYLEALNLAAKSDGLVGPRSVNPG